MKAFYRIIFLLTVASVVGVLAAIFYVARVLFLPFQIGWEGSTDMMKKTFEGMESFFRFIKDDNGGKHD